MICCRLWAGKFVRTQDAYLDVQVIAEVAVGRPHLGNGPWIGITAVIVAAAYAVAAAVPNIWPVMVSPYSSPRFHADPCRMLAGSLYERSIPSNGSHVPPRSGAIGVT